MRYLMLIFASVLLLTACSAQNTPVIVEDVTIELAVEPSPPAVGVSTLLITVRKADGTAIDGATVAVVGNMDHVGMETVTRETSQSVNGLYNLPFEWAMGGDWILNVTVTLPNNRGVATTRFETFVEAVAQESIINRTPTPHN